MILQLESCSADRSSPLSAQTKEGSNSFVPNMAPQEDQGGLLKVWTLSRDGAAMVAMSAPGAAQEVEDIVAYSATLKEQ